MTQRSGRVLVLLLVVAALATTLLWARPWQPSLSAVTTGEVSCTWEDGRAVIRVPVRVEGRGEVPVSVRGFVHRVREPRVQPYVSTESAQVGAGTRRVLEVTVPVTRAEWRGGRSACSAAAAVGQDPPVLP
jgi:hypothetical protein